MAGQDAQCFLRDAIAATFLANSSSPQGAMEDLRRWKRLRCAAMGAGFEESMTTSPSAISPPLAPAEREKRHLLARPGVIPPGIAAKTKAHPVNESPRRLRESPLGLLVEVGRWDSISIAAGAAEKVQILYGCRHPVWEENGGRLLSRFRCQIYHRG